MPGKRIPDLTAIAGASTANDDNLVIFDTSEGTTKRILRSQLAAGIVGDLPYTPSGSISAATIPTAIAELDSEAAKSAALAAPSGASLVGFLQSGSGAAARTTQTKMREFVSVKDFGAVGDGVTDDTAAFNAAIATGKRVFVPISANGYLVSNITVVDNMAIEGEKSGLCSGPKLLVGQNNAGAFLHSAGTPIFQIQISNFIIEANAGVTGASAYKQTNKGVYTAYCKFKNLETSANLLKSFDGFFIFTDWEDCRDGYIGSTGAQGHGWIDCIPSSWTQGNKANINSVKNSHCFRAEAGSSAILAAVDIGYGVNWTFSGCDFEALNLQAIRTRGIFNVRFESCWFERITAAQTCTFDVSPTPDGSRPVVFENCTFDLAYTTARCVFLGAASFSSFYNCGFIAVPSGVTLANAATTTQEILSPQVFSGAGSASFLTGYNTTQYVSGRLLANGATDDGYAQYQLNGIMRASGFSTSRAVSVSTSPVTIASFSYVGALAFVNGFNTSGGASGWWLVGFRGGVAVVISSSDATSTTPVFSVSGGDLRMNTTTGTLNVATSLLI